MISTFLKIVLAVHVAAGFIAMLGGLVPVLTRKGGAGHRRWGRVFTWSMIVVAASTVPLAAARMDPFQAVLGLLAGYAALLGKRTGSSEPPKPRDATLAVICASAFLGLAVGSMLWLFGGDRSTALLAFVFGAVGVGLSVRDLAVFLTNDRRLGHRIVDHVLSTILALCIAWGSFLNTQLYSLTGVRWPIEAKIGLPFMVAIPLLVYWLPRWWKRLREHGARSWVGAEPLEMERLHAFGIAEGTSLLLLVFIAVPLKRLAGEAAFVRILGPIHGALFVLYVICAFIAARSHRWGWRRTAITLLAGVVPFGTFLIRREIPVKLEAKS